MEITIYQINSERDENHMKFMAHNRLEKFQGSAEVDSKIYDMIYEKEVHCNSLEELYQMFNLNRPEDFKGHSLSVSDVVKVSGNEKIADGFYFCDSIGFKKVSFNPAECIVSDTKIQLCKNDFIEFAYTDCVENIKIRNAHKNSDKQSFLDEIETAVNNLITSLLTEDAKLKDYTLQDISEFINLYSSDKVLQSEILKRISDDVDAALIQLNKAKELAQKLDLPFSEKFFDYSDKFNPFAYDGSMSIEDFRKMQSFSLDEPAADDIEYRFRKCSEAEKDILIDNGFSDYRYSESDNKYIFRFPAEQEAKVNASLSSLLRHTVKK